MIQQRFIVGQRVRRIASDYRTIRVGDIATILAFRNNNYLVLEGHGTTGFSQRCFESVDDTTTDSAHQVLQIGDRVRIMSNHGGGGPALIGTEQTITRLGQTGSDGFYFCVMDGLREACYYNTAAVLVEPFKAPLKDIKNFKTYVLESVANEATK